MSSTQSHIEGTMVPSSDRQLELAVADMLRDQIESGNYKIGDWLPTERKLSEDLKVHRRVVRLAIDQLVRKGLVTRQPHCRPVVGGPSMAAPAVTPPNADATPSSNLIALLTSCEHDGTVCSQQRIFWGMNRALGESGYFAVFVDRGEVGNETDNSKREAEQLRFILKQGFGGAVFYPYAYRSNQKLIEEVQKAMPLVTIDRRIDSVQTDFVGVDNHGAMYDTIMYLVKKGHRRIAYITKNEQISPVQDRIQGYIDAMFDADLPELVLSMPSRVEQEWTAIDAVFQLPKDRRPTAAAVFNDYSARDVMQRLKDLGLSVPKDVALTGFDSIVPVLSTGIGLTSAAQPYEEIGRKAAEVLLRRLRDPSASIMSLSLAAPLSVKESSEMETII